MNLQLLPDNGIPVLCAGTVILTVRAAFLETTLNEVAWLVVIYSSMITSLNYCSLLFETWNTINHYLATLHHRGTWGHIVIYAMEYYLQNVYCTESKGKFWTSLDPDVHLHSNGAYCTLLSWR